MANELERRARELLAAEFPVEAWGILNLPMDRLRHDLCSSLRAIAAALQAQQPAEPMFTASMYGSAEAASKARAEWEAQQPGAQAVAQAPNRVRTEVYEDGKWRTLCVYGFPRSDPQPPSIPEPNHDDIAAALDAYMAKMRDDRSLWASIEAALTAYTARLRERIGQAPGGDGDA